MLLPDHGRTAIELGLTVVLHRWLVSPVTSWCAVRLGAGRYPDVALNGAYPEEAPRVRQCLEVGAVIAVLSAVAMTIGTVPRGWPALVPDVTLIIVLWKYLTLDYDVALDVRWQRVDRLVVLFVGVAALYWSALALAAVVLVCGRLGGWTHHSNVCIRLVKATFCYSLADGALDALVGTARVSSSTTLAVALGTVYLSHYVVAAWSKAKLGRFPWSWALENRTDLLVATSYAWGWARFIPARTAARIVSVLRPVAVLLNIVTMLVELAGLVAFVNLWFFVLAIVGAIVFNCVVALTSGLLFWENMLVGVVFSVAAVAATGTDDPIQFGAWQWLFSVVLMLLVLAGWAWRPNVLGWWDTPFSAKVLWTVETSDGENYGLYNDFMCPHDREYARALGNALVPESFVTFPLGGVEDVAIRDSLVRARPHPADIERAKKIYGTVHWNEGYASRHADYVRKLMTGVNSGTPKSPLPNRLRWLKAPGGHLYYWGDLPRYRKSKGHASRVSVWYREELYLSERREWLRLRDQLLFAIDIPAVSP